MKPIFQPDCLAFETVDVFTTSIFTGNPLAIVTADGIFDRTVDLQKIAKEFNLSETVFLEKSRGVDAIPEWHMRIFTPQVELPFAGHPTIGAACHLFRTLESAQETAASIASIRLHCKAGVILVNRDDLSRNNGWNEARNSVAAIVPHEYHVHEQEACNTADVYSSHPSLIGIELASIEVVSPVRGMSFACIELHGLEALGKVGYTGARTKVQLDDGWGGFRGEYFYVLESTTSEEGPFRIRARLLSEAYEDPATGSAACGLSSLLALRLRKRTAQFVVTQGVEMGRQSDIGVRVTTNSDLGSVKRVELIGSAVQVMEGRLRLG